MSVMAERSAAAAPGPKPEDFRRIVVKVGSALLVDRANGKLRADWLEAFVDDIARLASGGREILLVSSGAIALGRGVLGLPKGVLKLEESQAAAAVGQIALARAYSEMLGRHGITAGQILLTLGDTEERRRYLNARSTIGTLTRLGAIPVINENDTVATSEIRYGDNDRLAARVASMMGADLLVLLSDIDGLYTAPPQSNPDAKLIPVVERITPEIESIAGGPGSELSKGGMKTKVEAAKIATVAGATMVIALGKPLNPLKRISDGAAATWFLPESNPVTARKKWIAGHLETRGLIVIDDGAVKALRSGKSLLPAGVRRVEGRFQRGDAIVIQGLSGEEVGRGLVAYDAGDAERIAGRNTREIETILGYAGRAAMVHRDDMALRGE
ncbi:glutamate 5-kinase [Kaistia dalseonensis]|uniref:Glutamate 5-kinase n=1 Tax=Kaistia dalseonensis TaxID=410840 RepID=A0ABU0H5W5_9HYPH|nr:glutamate 5-kinase [Kaistia dalseonensis]MCX5494682.1 glutamate 5-kinase [Kaistia dalseonensis]MDQ0437263.1 glutamate 5-kinase [Kaistia dalseonensis]